MLFYPFKEGKEETLKMTTMYQHGKVVLRFYILLVMSVHSMCM